MDNFVTIATFTLPSEVSVAKSKLESEGIECRTLDELTVQNYNLLSNAVGGVKLQVKESDYKKAREILLEGGYSLIEKSTPGFIEQKLSNPTTFKLIKFVTISILTISGIMLIAALVYFLIQKPSDYEKLTENQWCLDHMIYDDKVYYPNTFTKSQENKPEFIFHSMGICDGVITFNPDGKLTMPGFSSRALAGKWDLDGDLIIDQMDTLGNRFNGSYDLEFGRNYVILESGTTQIICIKLDVRQ